ncbi:uncharacterized protein FOBCDRAFT_204000 [Fusarium oxysporum Fo47]|uniref:uncharacterized protein n=1 Tax=Fusarium oxysporum Fo47 TaxID=660027 RepID=UPI0028699CEF|nr:uncharacterized protein FOBCDRAFT_204000 [Fusarium oxysporum Fo47]QKD56962.2 hypothetical protein FOBCDRAFT_204000 [Fusarium oxysporum Fo47]
MAYAKDNGHDSSSTRSGGRSTDSLVLQSLVMTRPPAQTSMSALTAASSSNYASSVSSDSQNQNQSGGIPGTPPTIEDHAVDQQSSLRPKEDLDDSSDSSDEYMTSYRPLERSTRVSGSRSKRFFQFFVKKFNKSSVRYGLLPNCQIAPVIQHTVIIDVFEEQLHLAPISSKPRRVLDVGTGPGAWALPPYTRSNCSFMAMDITHDWDFTGSGNFDFIHIRQLGDIQDKKKLVQSTFENLKPGGWVEFTEWIAILQSPNHSLDGTAFRKWNDLLEQGMRSFGTTLHYPNKFKPLLQETGFEHIIETRNGAPTNACYPGKKLQRIGHLMTQNWLLVLEPLTMPVFTQALGLVSGSSQVVSG